MPRRAYASSHSDECPVISSSPSTFPLFTIRTKSETYAISSPGARSEWNGLPAPFLSSLSRYSSLIAVFEGKDALPENVAANAIAWNSKSDQVAPWYGTPINARVGSLMYQMSLWRLWVCWPFVTSTYRFSSVMFSYSHASKDLTFSSASSGFTPSAWNCLRNGKET